MSRLCFRATSLELARSAQGPFNVHRRACWRVGTYPQRPAWKMFMIRLLVARPEHSEAPTLDFRTFLAWWSCRPYGTVSKPSSCSCCSAACAVEAVSSRLPPAAVSCRSRLDQIVIGRSSAAPKSREAIPPNEVKPVEIHIIRCGCARVSYIMDASSSSPSSLLLSSSLLRLSIIRLTQLA